MRERRITYHASRITLGWFVFSESVRLCAVAVRRVSGTDNLAIATIVRRGRYRHATCTRSQRNRLSLLFIIGDHALVELFVAVGHDAGGKASFGLLSAGAPIEVGDAWRQG